MNLSALDYVLVAATLAGDAALFSILMVRRRYKDFFAFTALMAFEIVQIPVGYAILWRCSPGWYARFYYAAEAIEFALQLGVIWEIARIVMRPTGSWVRDAKKQFILGSAAGVLLVATLSWMLLPPASTFLYRLYMWSNFFTNLMFCELFVGMLLIARRFGLGFRNHVFSLVVGWSGWVMVAMAVDLLHSYYGTHLHFDALDNLRKFAYLAALVYWMVQFWLEEPARQEISPELRAYILALHSRVKNDLDTVKAQR